MRLPEVGLHQEKREKRDPAEGRSETTFVCFLDQFSELVLGLKICGQFKMSQQKSGRVSSMFIPILSSFGFSMFYPANLFMFLQLSSPSMTRPVCLTWPRVLLKIMSVCLRLVVLLN